MSKKGILIVAFGLGTFSAEQAFSAFCKEAENVFKPIPVRYGFTSEHSRKLLAERGKKSDSVKKAIEKMIFEKYTHIYIQSLHLIPGIEYQNLLATVEQIMQEQEILISVASPLFKEPSFFNQAVQSLSETAEILENDDEAIVYMGHGTHKHKEPQADALYADISYHLQTVDERIFLACMKGSVTLETILPTLKSRGYKKIYLYPLLTLIGRHATEDMAGENEDSWKSQLENEGFICDARCVSLLQTSDFIRFWLHSLQELLD